MLNESELNRTIERLERQLSKIQQEKVETEFAYLTIINSLSWKITLPLRVIVSGMKCLKEWLRIQKNRWKSKPSSKPHFLLFTNKAELIDQVADITQQVDKAILNYLRGTNTHAQ